MSLQIEHRNMTRDYHPPTLERCPKCGREARSAFWWTVEEHPENEAMVAPADDFDPSENLTFDVVELEVMRPCGHGVPRNLLREYVREARELGKDSLRAAGTQKTYNELRQAARKVEWSDEEHDMSDTEREILKRD